MGALLEGDALSQHSAAFAPGVFHLPLDELSCPRAGICVQGFVSLQAQPVLDRGCTVDATEISSSWQAQGQGQDGPWLVSLSLGVTNQDRLISSLECWMNSWEWAGPDEQLLFFPAPQECLWVPPLLCVCGQEHPRSRAWIWGAWGTGMRDMEEPEGTLTVRDTQTLPKGSQEIPKPPQELLQAEHITAATSPSVSS